MPPLRVGPRAQRFVRVSPPTSEQPPSSHDPRSSLVRSPRLPCARRSEYGLEPHADLNDRRATKRDEAA
jgi:hypothetical protein